jgi:monoamine oxidase
MRAMVRRGLICGIAVNCERRGVGAWCNGINNRLTMADPTRAALTRRRFLAASAFSAAAAAAPARAAQSADNVEIAIIGAGAAGIAAARRISGTRARFALIEATGRIGGRCFTDTQTFGAPFDMGARFIRQPDLNPVMPLATRAGFDIFPATTSQQLRIGRRFARATELEDFLTSIVRSSRAIGDAGRGKLDMPAAQGLPKDLFDWQSTVEFVLGPYACAKDLADVSAADFAHAAERDSDTYCRQGLGTVIAKLGEGLPVQLSSPVTRIEWAGRAGVEIETARGRVSARAAIVTVSTGMLTSDKIKFVPELPRRQLDALGKLTLGSYDHIALELPGNPLGLQRDELMFEKADSNRTAAVVGNLSGTNVCTVDVGGKFGRDLSAAGDKAMIAFAIEWLTNLYGNDVKKALKRSRVSQWNNDPWTLGAFSAATPGGQAARLALAEPLRDRIFLAGEATHETQWGTVGGAWASGDRAAETVLKRLGFATEERRPQAAAPTGRRR